MISLKKKTVWVTWRYKDGSKLPLSVITGKETGTNSSHSHEWTTFDELGETDKVGFIIPEGYFFLDVDHKDTQSEIVQNLLRQFPTYAEVSPSGNGINFYGKCDSSRLPVEVFNGKPTLSSRYYVKNSEKGLE